MGYGLSLILITIGAILAWGVNGSLSGINIHAVGAILMVVGVIGLAMTVLFWSSFSPMGREGGFARRRGVRTDAVVDDRPDVVIDRRPATTVIHEPAEPAVIVHDQERR